jgi:5'-deoxynucleotidase YfbR-like HD superfamily hydrolase
MVENCNNWAEVIVNQLRVDDYVSPVTPIDPLDVRADVDMIYRLYDMQKLVRFFGQRYWEEETLEYGLVSVNLKLENVAAHSFNVARCVPLLAPHFPWINRARAIELALVHDEPEIVTGDKDPVGDGQGSDTHAFNLTRRFDKEREERCALNALAAIMRDSVRESYRAMFEELITVSSEEASFVKAVDKLQALSFVRLRKGGQITADHAAFTIRYSRIGVRRFPPLQEHFKLVLRDLIDDVAHSRPHEVLTFCEEAYDRLMGADQ